MSYVPPELPWANCSGNIAAAKTVLEVRALPAEAATVTAGSPVTFSAPSTVPLTFAIASSPSLLANPDIDRGLAQPSGSENMQTFTSLKAGSAARTVYWTVSFQSEELPECSSFAFGPSSIPPRTLLITPDTSVAPQSVAPQTPQVSDLRATISQTRKDALAVEFGVRCNASCAGTVSYVAIVVRRGRSIRVPALDFGPHGVSITNPAGGMESFSRPYARVALRELKRLIHDHSALRFLVTASVRNVSGNVAIARATLPLAK